MEDGSAGGPKNRAVMAPDEEVYVNLEQLGRTGRRTGHQGPEQTVKFAPAGTRPVRTGSAEGGSETWWPHKEATGCLGLLSVVLLVSVIAVGALYARDVSQLSRDLANSTAERDRLLARNQNLTEDRKQLETSFRDTEVLLKSVKQKLGTCSNGWRQLGCSCYFLSTTFNSWEESKQLCVDRRAQLVLIDSQEEMLFLNKLGSSLKFWIGLQETSFTWRWTDGTSPAATFWMDRWGSWNQRSQSGTCAAFNSFQTGFYSTVRSWTKESCGNQLRWVCEKKPVPSGPEN